MGQTRPKEGKIARRTRRATAVLTRDHAEIEELFAAYRSTLPGDRRERRRLFARIHDCLMVLGRIEEEVFYPALRRADPELDL